MSPGGNATGTGEQLADAGAAKELFVRFLEADDAEASERPRRRAEAERALDEAPPQVRSSVLSLLAAHRRATGVLLDDGGVIEHEHSPLPPPELDDYEVGAELGRGGFGVVYEAQQTRPVRRAVALKIIRADLATRAAAGRFRAEAAALARLKHPGIASVYDTGIDRLGRPYLAVELIRGMPITTYCQTHRLSAAQRVELLAEVCDAVRHAHQRAVLHRDLKPANILVEEIDGSPRPRVIDFGIALLTDHGEQTKLTAEGQRIGTPRYMSPEQLDGGDSADTRVDVFALGTLLCEILAGGLPGDGRTGSRRAAARQATAGGTKPSAVSATLGSPACRPSELRGDLDRIVLMATAADPSHRYGSAAELAEDLRRFLRGEPVRATTPSRLYLTQKFVRRHPLGVGGALVATVLIAVALLVAINEAQKAKASRALADLGAARAQRVAEFILRDMVLATDPTKLRAIDEEPTVAGLLSSLERSVARGVPEDPWVRFDVLGYAAMAHEQLRNNDDAIRLARDGLVLGATLEPPPTARLLELERAVVKLDPALGTQERAAKRAALYERAQRELGPDNRVTVRLAWAVSRDEPDQAARLAALQRLAEQTVDNEVSYFAYYDIAAIMRTDGRLEDEISARRHTLATALRVAAPESARVMGTRHRLADALFRAERFDEALEELAPILEAPDEEVPAQHPGLATSNGLAIRTHMALGQHDGAVECAQRLCNRLLGAVGEDSAEHVRALLTLGEVQLSAGRAGDAVGTLERAAELCEQVEGLDADDRERAAEGLEEARAALEEEQ